MARTPKTQSRPEIAATVPVRELASMPARWGRKPQAAALSPASLAAATLDDSATDGVEADAATAGPAKTPGRRGSGRKPKTQPSPEAATAVPVTEPAASAKAIAPARRGRKPKAAAPSPASLAVSSIDDLATDGVEADTTTASPTKTPGRKPKHAAGAKAAFVSPDTPVEQAIAEADPSAAGSGQVRTASAAHWDDATDAVRFNWPEIERVAAAAGPNQGMAKLLVAARAEGVGSRWPF